MNMPLNTELSGLTGRFAPSPTGRMHAGNIFAYLMTWLLVKAGNGRIVLRIEDLDRERSKPEYSDAVMRDLERFGLTWDEGPFFQHDRDEAYQAAFDSFVDQGLVYPCFCTRADLHAASAPHFGEKAVYPGTCRSLTAEQIAAKSAERAPSMRLRVPDERISIDDMLQGEYAQNLETECGDFLIKRSDGCFAYQLAVVVDDIAQGVTFVSRGIDLLPSTPQQLHLYHLLDADAPLYAHFPLLVDQQGRRLSKRQKDASLDAMLQAFGSPQAVLGHIAFITGIQPDDEPATPEDLLAFVDVNRFRALYSGRISITWS